MSNKNNIDDLRTHLFDTLKGLKDGSMSIETAQAMSLVSQTIINTAKVEAEFAKATGESISSEFLGQAQEVLPNGITAIHKHRMLG